jgi:TRAP transporter 4TM/12TM fusion protein
MPPIMSAAAFIMADFLGVPYRKVAIAAIVPAILYYLGVLIQVDLEAGKNGLRGLAREELPRLGQAIYKGWLFVIPLSVLLYTLFILALEPGKAGIIGALSILLLSQFDRQTRFHITWLVEALEGTGRAILEISVIVAVAGFIIGCINITGMGVVVPMFLSHLAGGSRFLLLFVIAVASIFLGMGLPTIQLYILLAVLLAPAMITAGINPMAAHLFILYFGMLSMITPPVCFATYAGASIAGSELMRTGYASMRLGIVTYIVPFLFVFSPALLLMDSWTKIIVTTILAMGMCFLMGVASTGYLFSRLNWLKRSLFALAAAGIAFLILALDTVRMLGLLSGVGGALLAIGLLLREWRLNQRRKLNHYSIS